MLMLVAFGAFLTYSHVTETDRINSSERERLHTLTNVVASDIQNNLTTVNHTLEGVIQDFLVGHPVQSSDALLLRLRALESAIPGIRALLVLDAHGLVVTASQPILLGKDLSFRDYFKRAQQQSDSATLYVSAPFQSLKKEPDLVMAVSRVVLSQDGQFTGMVVAALNQDFFSDSFTPVVYAPDVWGFVVHGDGEQLLNYPEKKGIGGTNLNRSGTFFSRHRQSGQVESVVTGTMYTTGERRMMVLQTIQPAALHMDKAIVIGISRELTAIAVPLQHQAAAYSVFFVAISLLCCLALYWMQTRRSRIETLRVEIEQERLDANDRIKLALRGANLALWSVHIPTNTRWFDENCFAIMGIASLSTNEDTDLFRQRIHPDDYAACFSEVGTCINGSKPLLEVTVRMQHSLGHWIWILTRGQAIERDANGRAVMLMGTFMDISVTKTAEQEVVRGRNELQVIFDNMTEGVFVFDNTNTLIRANDAARSIHGLFYQPRSIEEVWSGIDVYLPNGEILPKENWPTRRGFREDFVRNFELEIRRKDTGMAVFVNVNVTPVYGESKELSLLIVTFTNITEQRLTHALRESEARFRTLIEDAPLAIAILRGGHFVYTNPRYNILHGYAPTDDLKDQPWQTMISPESLDQLHEQETLINEDSPIEQMFEAHGLGNNGKLVPVFKTTTRVELVDGPATLIFAQDISAQKRAESLLLEARDAAETANRSKAEFLANMSHEIRSPLNAILGLAYLLEQAHLDLDAHNMVHKIRKSGRMLLGIINDILDVSKIDAGHMVIEQAPFKLGDVVDNIASSMGVILGDKDIQLIIQPPPAGILSLIGDALRLEQILNNLTSNAIKFTHEGRVELCISLQSQNEKHVVLRFCVKDTGVGIPLELQTAVFSAFTQADSSTTRRFGGTGLGLTICRQLVSLMGGEIGLTSTPGQGSEFWFTLPLQLITNADFSSPDMVRVDAMIADSCDIELKAITDIALGLGWQVSALASGEAVLAEIMERKDGELPDVVILDWNIPGMDGLETAHAIRACLADDECPVVIMATAFSLSSLASRPGAELVDAILNKPVTTSALYNATIEAQRRRAVSFGTSHTVAQTTTYGLAGIRLLVVDDSEINRDVAQRILQGEGAIVTLAVDGKDALDWLQAHPDDVDLVLMDVQMPVMDGIEATTRLRLMPQFNDLPIVALTAGAFQSQQEAARAAGMTHFISKPFDVPTTVTLIQRLRRTQNSVNSDTHNINDATPAERANIELPTDLPVIDIAKGLQIWPNLQTYRDYLRRFVKGYGNTINVINASLVNDDRPGAAALVHKLAGVAGSMAMPTTYRLAIEAERVLASEYDATLILGRLDDALKQVIVAIDRFAPAVVMEQLVPASTFTVGDMSSALCAQLDILLAALLKALDTDNPAPVRKILSTLVTLLPAQELSAIRENVHAFDFRAAETATIKLAQQIGITLE
ncbi:PAS domain S-box protein [Solimicrobium silvestre]|uniref:Sensory/regulatory protein RpfC n=2 Tax=Solimicrobium silvestre TaxID=2099400 RepID=A0A2S9H329_9BURK|nr:PAS domain S-box protein [Solimicrobium silvestre]